MLLADEHIQCLQALFAPLLAEGEKINTLAGRSITPEQIPSAWQEAIEILLVRSVTPVNAALLDALPNLKFVGTATIGTDHLDIAELNRRGIQWANAPGCNAEAVGEYVLSALLILAKREQVALNSRTVGIVGLGHTGSAVARRLRALGVTVLCCDPPKAKASFAPPELGWHTLEQLIAQCDVLTLHVPKQSDTQHLLDEPRLRQLQQGCWLINTCRGEVIDNQALLRVAKQRADLKLVLDVWENEPEPDRNLLAECDIASAHIAGYSVEGKIRGSFMLYQALKQSKFSGLFNTEYPSLESLFSDLALDIIRFNEPMTQVLLHQLCQRVYDLEQEDQYFRQASQYQGGFDSRRKANLARREFSALKIQLPYRKDANQLAALGFSTEE